MISAKINAKFHLIEHSFISKVRGRHFEFNLRFFGGNCFQSVLLLSILVMKANTKGFYALFMKRCRTESALKYPLCFI